MPDDPKKLIEYVLVFLPGFISLGFFVYVTDLALSEFAFTYLSITLSLLIFGVVRVVTGWRLRITAKKSFYEGLAPGRLIILTTVTVLAALGLVLIYQSQIVLWAMHRLAPATVMKLSQHSTFRGLMSAEARDRLHTEIDQRDSLFRISVRKSDKYFIAEQYKMYVRFVLENNAIYEGRVIRFDTAPTTDGFPVILSPACRVSIDPTSRVERFERIPGPGVYLTGKDLKYIELYESLASGCKRCYTPQGGKKLEDASCADVGVKP